jgi:CDP-6-deoxy-D-xylo-4-hexulose-3-dehydrase
MLENEAKGLRLQMLELAKTYGDIVSREPEFVPGETTIPITRKIWDGLEMSYMADAVLDGWWTEGRFTDGFEEHFAKWIGRRFASFCNSGSSANFLALGACTSHLLGDRRLRAGDPVITTATGFPTTIAPILFWRLKPVFLDTKIGTYLPEPEDIAGAIEKFCPDGRGAVMLAHTLGNPWPANRFMDREGIFIIEDNCDALGSVIDKKKTGTLGHLATHSFYPAHHMTTGEGGMVVTDDGKLKLAVESIRDWGRDCWCPPGEENTCGKRFDWEFENLPQGYDHKYVYSHLGLNLKSTDLQAALGLAQLNRLDIFVEQRKTNYWLIRTLAVKQIESHFILPESDRAAMPSWFGFPLTIKRDGTEPMLERDALIRFLTERKIGTRLLFAGNYLAQPAFRNTLKNGWETEFAVFDHLSGSDRIKEDTFWIACHPGLTPEMIEYMIDSIEEFISE